MQLPQTRVARDLVPLNNSSDQLWEIEREKRMILEGKMGVDEAPYILEYPGFAVSKMTNSILEERRQLVADKFRPRVHAVLEEDQRPALEEEEDLDTFMELDEEEVERARKLWEIGRQIDEGEIFTQEQYDKVKYEAPLIKKLRTLESVAELYRLAEEIVGPIRSHHGKHCERQG